MKKLLGTIIIVMVVGCYPYDPGQPPTTTTTVYQPKMYCEPFYSSGACNDGRYPEVCISYDGLSCGFKVQGRYFMCANCNAIDYGGCDGAAASAVAHCYGYTGSGLQSDIPDELTTEIVDFQDALEFLKETR